MLKENLIKRQEYLHRIIEKANKIIGDSPEGTVKIISKGSDLYYRLKTAESSVNGKYVHKSNIELIKKTANRNYCIKVLKIALKEEQLINRLLKFYLFNDLSKIYENMHKNRKSLINPLEVSNQTFSSIWLSEAYEGKYFNTSNGCFLTDRNEKVRSKSEALIANKLNALKIPYKYEYPHRFNDKTIYPDFTILNPNTRSEIIYEHFGMMDDEDYRNNAFNKIELYVQNGYIPGISFICTFESHTHPFNLAVIERMLKNILQVK